MLQQCTGHVLHAALTVCLERKETGQREREAERRWAELKAKADSKANNAQSETLLAELSSFQKSFAGTSLLKASASEIDAILNRLGTALRPSRRLVQAAFHGQMAEYDPDSQRATVLYDFKTPPQLLDFDAVGRSTLKIENCRLVCVSEDGGEARLAFQGLEAEGLELLLGLPGRSFETRWTLLVGSRNPVQVVFTSTEVRLLRPRTARESLLLAGPVLLEAVWEPPKDGQIRLRLRDAEFVLEAGGKTVLRKSLAGMPGGARIELSAPKELAIEAWAVSGLPSQGRLEDASRLSELLRQRPAKPRVAWTNAAGDGRWLNAANWDSGKVPGANDEVIFDGRVGSDCRVESGAELEALGALTILPDFRGTLDFEPGFGPQYGQLLKVAGRISLLGGAVVVSGLAKSRIEGVGMTIACSELYLGSRAVFNSNRRGFPGGQGPSYGGEVLGSSHGGRGGWRISEPYGDPHAPVTLGSGGGAKGDVGCGGGAIRIEAAIAAVNGTLSCNGGDPRPFSKTSGGAGGSVFIVCKQFSGHGLVQANGGNSEWGRTGAAGGGRIAVAAREYRYRGAYECAGGLRCGERDAEPGTLQLPAGADLSIDGELGLPPGQQEFGRLRIAGTGHLLAHADRNPDGNAGTHDGKGCTIRAKRIEIEKGGILDALEQGYPCAMGPAAHRGGCGGTHGGRGGGAACTPYGDSNLPTSLGGGGGGAGGGAIRIEVPEGALVIDGTLSADGNDNTHPREAPGNAGGSILVVADSFEGSGAVHADGGSVVGGGLHGGGGGRIAVYCGKNVYKGTLSARGGLGTENGKAGEDGTVLVLKR